MQFQSLLSVFVTVLALQWEQTTKYLAEHQQELDDLKINSNAEKYEEVDAKFRKIQQVRADWGLLYKPEFGEGAVDEGAMGTKTISEGQGEQEVRRLDCPGCQHTPCSRVKPLECFSVEVSPKRSWEPQLL